MNKQKAIPARFLKILAWSLLAFALLGLTRVLLDSRLAAFGVITDGSVTHMEVKSSSSSTTRRSGESWSEYQRRRDRSRGSSTHYATVRFQPAGGGEPRDFKTVCTFNYEPAVGDGVKVIHLPSDPGVAEIYSTKQLWWPIGIGITVTLATSALGAWLLRLSRRIQKGPAGGSERIPPAVQIVRA